MFVLNPKTLSASTLIPKSFIIPRKASIPPQFSNFKSRTYCNANQITERGILFDTGDTFFRHESATGRDLGVLSAALYKQSKGQLRVLDAMCGCGVRSLRYLIQSKADFVLANDANESHRRVILDNLGQVGRFEGEQRRWVVTHNEATRVLTDCYLQRDYFDYIDLDSFGSDSSFFLRAAFSSLKLGGLVYVTSTDGFSSGGHRPFHSLEAFGAYVRPMPYANELGLRILIGGAVREASVLGYRVTPLFSYYSCHGPVFRVLLQVHRGKLTEKRDYGFICYCNRCGNSQTVSWGKLGQISCPCNNTIKDPASLVVSGPLWTGPLHSGNYIMEMLNLAEQWGWVGKGAGTGLEKLLERMLEESDPRLPFGYIKLDEVASRAKTNTPSISTITSALHKEGYAASRSHIASSAIKTDCPMAGCIRIAQKLHGC
ncbi:tRNA methyltransferase 1c [Hibiscus trionum]|uniref:tRNA (guanine(26)-N(2))-dimethyltransferase n=1 Tax=Hibiscus trionum TaxID=183268 RepID=A0A9W7I7A2_HIBTR|nr:tRNA methyltransferase 1c [Hibiscus trionum]